MDILAEHGLDPEKFALGNLCKRGHDFEGTGKSLRYLVTTGKYAGRPGTCRDCKNQKWEQWKQENPEQYQASNKRYYKENRDRLLEQTKQYYQDHKAERIAYTLEWEKRYKSENPSKYKEIRRKCDSNWRKKFGGNYKCIRNERARQSYKDNPLKYKLLVSQRRSLRLQNHAGIVTKETLKELELSFDSKCAYCQARPFKHWDHFIPISKGGPDAAGNLIPACVKCNLSKHASDPLEWYKSQPFYSPKQWKKILRILGKTPEAYNQIPLF